MEENRKATINDVAKLAGVSISTVSRVLNKNYPVKDETRKKVEEAIKTLQYSPNLLARGLIQDKTKTIGIVTPSIENLFFSEVIKGIDELTRERDYNTFLCTTNSNYDNEKKMIESMLNRNVDGIICIGPITDNIKSGYYEELAIKIPLVIINGYNKGIKCNFVLNDEETGFIKGLEYLGKMGHRHIAFVRGQKSYSYDLKEEIYRTFMKESLIEDYIIWIDNGNEIDTVNKTKDKIEEFIKKNKEVTAIVTCNDFMAVGALNAAINLGMDIPNDLSIIGFDNTIVSQITQPKITTIDQKMTLLGKQAAQRLFEIFDQKQYVNKKIIIDTDLIIRESCNKTQDKTM